MNINTGININSKFLINKPSFGHSKGSEKENNYTKKQKAIVAGMTALGVATSCAILSKTAGHSFLPTIKTFKNLKDSYLAKVKFEEKEVITIGAGSCLGGLIGGCMIDKNKTNRKVKTREALMQIGNISIPIITVGAFAKIGEKFGNIAKSLLAFGGIFVGVYLANFVMNHITNFIYNDKNGARGVEATDFSAHLDDGVVAAQYVFPKSKLVHYIARFIPAALMFAGNEIGTKQVIPKKQN